MKLKHFIKLLRRKDFFIYSIPDIFYINMAGGKLQKDGTRKKLKFREEQEPFFSRPSKLMDFIKKDSNWTGARYSLPVPQNVPPREPVMVVGPELYVKMMAEYKAYGYVSD